MNYPIRKNLQYSILYDYCSSCDRGWQNVSNTKFLEIPSQVYSEYGYRVIPIKMTQKAEEDKDYDDDPYPSLVPYYGEVGRKAFYRYKDRGTNKDERNYYKILGEDSNINPGEYTVRGLKNSFIETPSENQPETSKENYQPYFKSCKTCGNT